MRFPAILLPLSFFVASVARPADWPQWRGPDRNGCVPAGVAVPTTLPTEPKVAWHVKIGDGLASPVVASGRVFYLDNQQGRETLHALDVANANEFWHDDIGETFSDEQSPPGPRCTPMVDSDRVYAQSCRGELRCVSAADGHLLWRTDYVADFGAVVMGENGNSQGASRHGYSASPVIDGAALFALVGGKDGAGVVAFEKYTGRVLWKSQNDEPAYAAPVVANIGGVKQLVAFTVNGAVGLALKDGGLLWRVPLKTSSGRHVTTPVVVDDMVLVGSHEIGLVGIKVSRNGDGWQAVQAWRSRESAVNFSSPVAVGDYYYGLGPNKNLFCTEIKTGRQAWSKEGYINGGAERSHASFIVMGENILTLTDGGELVFFAAKPEAFKEIGQAQVCGRTWCNPAYADGKLYLRDGRELMCVNLMP